MSLPSYKLSKIGGVWVATGKLPSDRPFRIEAGKGSKETADAIVEIKLRGKLASSKGSRDRWQKWHREKAETVGARAEGTAGAPAAPASASAPASTAAPRVPPRRDDAELRSKLLGLGDSQPIDASSSTSSSSPSSSGPTSVEPDEVIAPGAARDDDQADEIDDEGGELIAGLLAKGAVLGLVALTNAQLKKRKPPQKGEPHEKGLEWFHDGLEVQLAKLLGRTATLGPTGKIFAGAAIIVASIYMTAEPIEGAAAAPPSAAAPAPTEASAPTNGAQQPTEERGLATMNLGVFGKERN